MGEERMSDEEHARWSRDRGQRELAQLLYWCWDPIGVNDGFPLNEDEYDSHTGKILGLVKNGAGAETVGAYLGSVESDSGMPGTSEDHRLNVGRRVIEWYPNSLSYWEMHR